MTKVYEYPCFDCGNIAKSVGEPFIFGDGLTIELAEYKCEACKLEFCAPTEPPEVIDLVEKAVEG